MSRKNWFDRLFSVNARKRRSTLRRRRSVPRLEHLEDRCLLAAISWDGDGDGVSWNDRFNWDTDTLPGAADDAIIDDGNANNVLAVDYLGGTTTIKSLHNAENLELSGGGILTVSGTANNSGLVDVQSGSLSLSGGTSSGDFIVAAGAWLSFMTHQLQPTSSVMGQGSVSLGRAKVGISW